MNQHVPFPYTIVNILFSLVTTYPCSHAFAVQKFRCLRSSRRGGKIVDCSGYKFVLDFDVQIFERFGVQIFVHLAWFHENETPRRMNFHRSKTRPVSFERSHNQHSEKSISVAVFPEIKVCPHKIDLQTL